MKIKDIFSYFERRRERKKWENQEHHNLVKSKMDNLVKCDTRILSNMELWRAVNDIWNLIEHSANVCGEGDDWAEDEFFDLSNLFKDYDLRVEIFIIRLLDEKGDELIEKLDKII